MLHAGGSYRPVLTIGKKLGILISGERNAWWSVGLFRTGLVNPHHAPAAVSIVVLAAFNVAWVSRAIFPFAMKLSSLAFRVVVE